MLPEDTVPPQSSRQVAQASMEEIEAQAGQYRVRIRGSDWLGAGTFIVALAVAFLLWNHGEATKAATAEMTTALHETNASLKAQTVAQREGNCLLGFEEKERVNKAEWCKRIAQ